jgi:hypothetical protein
MEVDGIKYNMYMIIIWIYIFIHYIYIYTYHSSVYMHEWIEWMEHIRGNHDFQHDGSDGIGHFKS